MPETIVKLELVLSPVEANISKQYRLGQVGTQTLRGDFQPPGLSEVEVWWHRLRGK